MVKILTILNITVNIYGDDKMSKNSTSIFGNIVNSSIFVAQGIIRTVTYYSNIFEIKFNSWVDSFFWNTTPAGVVLDSNNAAETPAHTVLKHQKSALPTKSYGSSEEADDESDNEDAIVTTKSLAKRHHQNKIEENDGTEADDESDDEDAIVTTKSLAKRHHQNKIEENDGTEADDESDDEDAVSINSPFMQRLLSSTKIEQVKAEYMLLSDKEKKEVENFTEFDRTQSDQNTKEDEDSGYTNYDGEFEGDKSDFEWDSDHDFALSGPHQSFSNKLSQYSYPEDIANKIVACRIDNCMKDFNKATKLGLEEPVSHNELFFEGHCIGLASYCPNPSWIGTEC